MNHPLFQHVDFEFLIDEFAKALFLIIEVASMVCRVSTVCILFMNRSSTGKFVHAGEWAADWEVDQGNTRSRAKYQEVPRKWDFNGFDVVEILLRKDYRNHPRHAEVPNGGVNINEPSTWATLMQMPGCMKRWNHEHPHHVNVWQRRFFPMLFWGETDGSGHKWMNERVIHRLSISISFKNLWYSRLVCRIWCRMVIELNDAVVVPWGPVGMV